MERSTRTATVLVVDDESALRLYMARVLEDAGYTVLEAEGGAEALALLDREEGGMVDLVITDVRMPGMSGRDLAARLARRDTAPPVLFVSGSHTLSDVPGPLLRKPFLPDDLSAVAGGLIRRIASAPSF